MDHGRLGDRPSGRQTYIWFQLGLVGLGAIVRMFCCPNVWQPNWNIVIIKENKLATDTG